MIKNIKTIFVKYMFNIGSSFAVIINLDFEPHEMIVKKIDFNSIDENGGNMFFVRSDLVNDYIGYSRNFAVNVSNELQTRFQIKNPIRGVYNFEIHNIIDAFAFIEGELVICLEFIEYEK